MNKALRLDYQQPKPAASYALARSVRGDQAVRSDSDELLLPFVEASTSADSDDALARLIETARPVIDRIIKSKLHVSLRDADASRENQDALEIRCEVQASLIVALRQLRENGRQSISDFQSYVAVIAFNACYEHLRRKYPRRHGLKNRLRYLLSRRVGFSLWEIDGILCGGLTVWRFQKREPSTEGDLRRLLADSNDSRHLHMAGTDLRSHALEELIHELFRRMEAPVELDLLVSLITDVMKINEGWQEIEQKREESGYADPFELLPERGASPAIEVERRLQLERLWIEICQLPPRQRAALLLNMRDARGGGVNLFPVTGVASLRQVAEALSMSAEELAVLWNELPLEDAAIAERLCVTRQQVINLRKSARERLARRMKAAW